MSCCPLQNERRLWTRYRSAAAQMCYLHTDTDEDGNTVRWYRRLEEYDYKRYTISPSPTVHECLQTSTIRYYDSDHYVSTGSCGYPTAEDVDNTSTCPPSGSTPASPSGRFVRNWLDDIDEPPTDDIIAAADAALAAADWVGEYDPTTPYGVYTFSGNPADYTTGGIGMILAQASAGVQDYSELLWEFRYEIRGPLGLTFYYQEVTYDMLGDPAPVELSRVNRSIDIPAGGDTGWISVDKPDGTISFQSWVIMENGIFVPTGIPYSLP